MTETKNKNNFNIPVLFLVFNRPDTTQLVFAEIKRIKPAFLSIAGDGPRNKNDEENIKLTRAVVDQIDWDCNIKTLFRETNLGCKIAVSSAINWFFENNEMGIILEDDCVPHPSFFKYCEELLIKYKDEEKVMQICGFNALNKVSIKESYYFSKFGPIWGWATWKRAWQNYDVNMTAWENVKRNKLYKNFCDSIIEQKWRVKLFDKVFNEEINTWDYQWVFSKLIKDGLSIVPNVNLISNIGFGKEATHTHNSSNNSQNLKLNEITFPVIHPENISRNKHLDKKYFYEYVMFNILKGWWYKYSNYLKHRG